MARSTTIIKAQIVAAIQADPVLSTRLTSPSATAIWNLFAFIVAQAINICEQLMDVFKTEVEDIAARSYYGTSLWWQQQMLNFQYSDTNPQVIQVIDNTISYPVIDESLRIITAASVKTNSGTLSIKVAKGDIGTLGPLTSDELTSASDYATSITPAGINPVVVSLNPDQILVRAEIFYLGQYVSTLVKANIIAALNSYISNLDFNGIIYVSKIEDAIQSVEGVKDLVIQEVIVRKDSQTIPEGTVLVEDSQTISRKYDDQNSAGYFIGETTSGSTFDDTITMTAA